MKNIDKENISFKTYLKVLFLLLFQPVKFFIRFFPRDKNIWLFGVAVGKRYADNSKALFEYCNLLETQIRPIWITKNKKVKQEVKKLGYECYLAYEPMGLYYSLRGGVYIYCSTTSDINHWTSFGAFNVNLWHGTPMKKIARDIENSNDRYYKIKTSRGLKRIFYKLVFPGFFEKIDLFCSASEEASKRYKSAWNLKNEQIKITGYPRNDKLFIKKELEISEEKIKIVNNAFLNKKKIITYLPTYRERTSSVFPLDFKKLEKKMRELDAIFVIKLHPFDNSKFDLDDFSNIICLESKIDIYPLLAISDILVTDYSSVVFDFIVLDRPIIYFVYDLEDYINNDRGMYEPFEKTIAGDIVINTEELLNSIEQNLKYDYQKKLRQKMISKYNYYLDNKNSERVYNQIIEVLK